MLVHCALPRRGLAWLHGTPWAVCHAQLGSASAAPSHSGLESRTFLLQTSMAMPSKACRLHISEGAAVHVFLSPLSCHTGVGNHSSPRSSAEWDRCPFQVMRPAGLGRCWEAPPPPSMFSAFKLCRLHISEGADNITCSNACTP